LAYAELDVIVHRSGRPVPHNINIRVVDFRGSTYGRGYTRDGRCSLRVPENEMYKVVLDQFSSNNEIRVPAHRGKQGIDFDLDSMQTR